MKKQCNALVNDERTYIESIGKQDKETVRAALADKGADTVLRVCIGVNGQRMPVRTLGYYASALAVQEYYFPEAEVQFVYPLHAAVAINGIDKDTAEEVSEDAHFAGRQTFSRLFDTESPDYIRVGGYGDTVIPNEDMTTAVAEVLLAQPALAERFMTAAAARGTRFESYVAAHLLMHDTQPLLKSFSSRQTEVSHAKRVISIGAQSERPFYAARMACRQAAVLPEEDQIETGQLFTRHVLPPYISCRQGEPIIEPNTDDVNPGIPDVASVQRDLDYLTRRETFETERIKEMTEMAYENVYCAGRILVRKYI